MKTIITTIAAALVFTGCAGTGQNYTPIVDRPGAGYTQDLSDCQAHAAQMAGAGGGAVAGAVAGALFGAVLMGILGGSRNQGAMAGAFGGLTGGAARGETDQRTVISNCMRARGHAVISG